MITDTIYDGGWPEREEDEREGEEPDAEEADEIDWRGDEHPDTDPLEAMGLGERFPGEGLAGPEYWAYRQWLDGEAAQ